MQAINWLIEHEFAQRAMITGVVISSVCSLLSVAVVLKRMAFIGQGISHAGFGGVGLAIFLGGIFTFARHPLSLDIIVLLFCLITAFAIGAMSRRGQLEPDSAIGILLVAGMAVGVLLDAMTMTPSYIQRFGPVQFRPSFETVLFGSIMNISKARMWMSIGLSAAVLVVCVVMFKEILFFTFDEATSRVFGLRTSMIYYLLLTLLAITIVLTMMLVGVVLVSALLVIPGATALQLSRRLSGVLIWSWVVGVVGMVGGLLLSLQVGSLPTGPCVAAVLCLIFAAVYLTRTLTTRAIAGRNP